MSRKRSPPEINQSSNSFPAGHRLSTEINSLNLKLKSLKRLKSTLVGGVTADKYPIPKM